MKPRDDLADLLNKAERQREVNRARQKKHKARVKAGLMCARPEIDGDVIDMLVRTDWLLERDATDGKKVNEALSAMLTDMAHNYFGTAVPRWPNRPRILGE